MYFGAWMKKQSDFENIFSFDVEEWFHLRRNEEHLPLEKWDALPPRLPEALDHALELLAETGNRATFFWLGWCAEKYPEWVRRVADAGHEIACHGYSHAALDRLTPGAFRDELRRSRDRLQELCGRPVVGFRAPSLSLGPATAWLLEILAEEGFRYDSSLLVTSWRANRAEEEEGDLASLDGLAEQLEIVTPWQWETKAGPIVELPISVRPFGSLNLPFAGGLFFRCAPYSAVAAHLRQINRRGQAGIFYAHPWELDAKSPSPEEPYSEKFAHRFFKRIGRWRYRRLLRQFRFIPAAEAIDRMHFPHDPQNRIPAQSTEGSAGK